jgi:hypothetical protein
VQQKPFLLMKNLKGKVTQVAIGQPAGGRWRVVVEDGSSPVVSIKSAEGLEPPRVDARVVGHGHERAIAYHIAARKGQTVTFVERGASGGTIIGVAKGERGRVAFKPGDGRAERRKIVALVAQDGQLRDSIEVAQYRAPGAWRPARPAHVRLRRHGRRLVVSWTRVRGVRGYEVAVRLSDGRRLVRRSPRRSLAVDRVAARTRATVSVRAMSQSATKGRAAVARLAAAGRATP